MIDHPSPNFGPRPSALIDILVLHYTGMLSAEAALGRLCDPAAGVSCHWLIDEAGTVYRLVDEAERAWHAGVAFWSGVTDINSRSIGIELVNPGHEWGYRPFPPAQMEALVELAGAIVRRHPIPAHRVLAHSDVAPRRKQDPGELFDWSWLAARGIGIWPDPSASAPSIEPSAGLARIGYEVPPATLTATVTAFQRHWRQGRIDGVVDPETAERIAQVAALCPPGD